MTNLRSKAKLTAILILLTPIIFYAITQGGSAQTTSQSPPAQGCVTSLWSAEGNANDMTGVNNGVLTNGATFGAGNIGQAFSLDGVDDYVDVPINNAAMNSPASFTWEAQINPNTLANNPVVFSKEGNVFNRAGLQILPDGSLCSYMNSSTCNAISAAGLITTGAFSTVKLSYDGSTGVLTTYVNGASVTQASVAYTYSNNSHFNIGWSPNGSGNTHFNGLIDEVKFTGCAANSSPTPTPTPTPVVTPSPTVTPTPYCPHTSVTVPGTSNPYLAGMPAGTGDPWGDSVPGQSPVLVNGIQVIGGMSLTFSATGAVGFDSINYTSPPDGNGGTGEEHITGLAGENGISDIVAPLNSLLGVFLDDTQPNLTPAPSPIYFYSSSQEGSYLSLSPGLKQVFFIGDGKTASGITQTIVAPAGAKRLFLGTMDGSAWNNNQGSFNVTIISNTCVTSKPPPPVVTGGLPTDGGLLGPGDPSSPGHVNTVVTGTAHAGCTVQLTVTDPHETGGNNNRTLTTTVDSSGNWAIPLTLDDCDPVIDIVVICDGVSSDPVHRHIYVDGTPPVFTDGGPTDGTTFVNVGGGSGGTATVILDGGASDPNTYHCLANCGGVSYEWHLLGSGGSFTILGGGGASGTLTGGGSGISIDLPPGDYDFEVIVTDPAGNKLRKRCHRTVRKPVQPVTVTGGLPADGGIYGPGTPGNPGHVTRTITGTGNPGCTINIAVSDPDHPQSTANNQTYTAAVDTSGNWSLNLTLDDCDPVIEITEVCDGASGGGSITRHVYVDGTPPIFISGGGPGDDLTYTGGGGTSHIILDGGASDAGTHVLGGGVTYEWYRYDGDGSTGVLIGGANGGTLTLDLGTGDYGFEVVVTDTAGNKLRKRCHRRVRKPLTITSGLPGDEGIYGPGDPSSPGHVLRIVTGTGNPGCTVNVKVTDTHHPNDARNNATYTTVVNPNGNWSLSLDLDDCDPVVEVYEVCEGADDTHLRQHIYVDGTPPTVGLGDGSIYVGTGGTGEIILDAGASDTGSEVPNDGLSYQWYIIGGGVSTLLCDTNCPGVYKLDKGVGEYDFEVVATDKAGNKTRKRCHRRVLKRPTTTSCAGTTIDFGGLVTLSATLKDTLTGAVITGKTLTYKINGQSVPNPFEAFLIPGSYPVEVDFAGDDIYQSCSTTNGCPLVVRSTPGKITGGGSIDQSIRNLGFVVQTKSQGGTISYTGSLEFQDKSKNYNLKSTSINLIAISMDHLRGVFTGTATINGVAGYSFTVWVDDLAEPGSGVDKFRIQISGPNGFSYDSNDYATKGGVLDQGGNIQIHKMN